MNSYKHTRRDFLPLSVIRSACAGDTDAVEQVLRHYRGYINKLCTGILYDKHGQPHVCIDEYMKRHLEIKLISSIQLAFLKQLLERKLITDREYSLIKQRLMKDYRVVSELSS